MRSVSQRMPITVMESVVSNAERRSLLTGDEPIVPRVADIYAAIGSLPDEAYLHLRAAEQQLSTGRAAEARAQLQQALAFYRRVTATGYLRQTDELVAASA